MKKSKKLKRKLLSRQIDWEATVGKKNEKAYRKPGSNHKG